MAKILTDHWNKIYAENPITQLSWYEAEPYPSLQLIDNCAFEKDDLLVDIGSGASTLISRLLERGYRNIYAVDISDVALEKARELLGARATQIHWMIDDVASPRAILELHGVCLWHDRAVFHFLIEESQRQTYLSTVRKLVKNGGYVIIATFSSAAPDKCSGLSVQRYSVESLTGMVGGEFELIESLNYTYTMPSGDIRPYIYTLFQKTED